VIRSSPGLSSRCDGRKILQELEQLLPKIEGLVVPSVFDPKWGAEQFPHFWPGHNVCIALLTALVPPLRLKVIR